MSSSRDDFGIAFRSALLQRGAAQIFIIFFNYFSCNYFFLDNYDFKFMKPIRSVINDGIYRVSLVASSPTRFLPQITGEVSNLIKIKSENKRLKKELENYKIKRTQCRIFKKIKIKT